MYASKKEDYIMYFDPDDGELCFTLKDPRDTVAHEGLVDITELAIVDGDEINMFLMLYPITTKEILRTQIKSWKDYSGDLDRKYFWVTKNGVVNRYINVFVNWK